MTAPRDTRWLLKSEPEEFSIDDLAIRPGQRGTWDGVRNYQARNYLRDAMQVGDLAFFYHSSCAEPGIYGVISIARAAYPDPAQFDRRSAYYDPKSDAAAPRWCAIDVRLVERWDAPVTLERLRGLAACADMVTLRRGNRLSITPVTMREWRAVCAAAGR
jgi:predicted RNA-binding protein with PUA-like domain